MTEVEIPIRSGSEGSVQPTIRPVSPIRWALVGAVATLALLGAGAVGFLVADGRGGETATAASAGSGEVDPAGPDIGADAAEADDADPSASPAPVQVDTGPEQAEVDPADGDVAEGDLAGGDPADVDPAGGDSASGDSAGGDSVGGAVGTDGGVDPVERTVGERPPLSARTATLRGGKLYMGGRVPSRDVADRLIEGASAVLGAENVVDEYEIDPSVVMAPDEAVPLVLEGIITFAPNSTVVAPEFEAVLDLGVVLLRLNPQMTIWVITRTDASGSADLNLRLSERRAASIIDYMVARGVDPDQLVADPRGEEGASGDPARAAAERRAEFAAQGLLG